MGCTFSKHHHPTGPRVFKVLNVDDSGQELRSGRMQITESELILYQRSKDPIHWPLHSLRRYGFDAELLSFECGRRCQTGAGIFAFKCRRAEAVFNLLQDSTKRAGQEDNQNAVTHVRGSGHFESNGGVQSLPLLPQQAPPTLEEQPPGYINFDSAGSQHNGSVASTAPFVPIVVSRPHGASDADSGLSASRASQIPRSRSQQHAPPPQQQEYANAVAMVDPSAVHVVTNTRPTEPVRALNYAQLDLMAANNNAAVVNGDSDVDVMYVNVNTPAPSIQTSTSVPVPNLVTPQDDMRSYQNIQKAPRLKSKSSKVQYIQLDLHRSSDNVTLPGSGGPPPASPISLTSSVPESPIRKSSATGSTTTAAAGNGLQQPVGGAEGQSYATIDFNKTAALSNTTKSSVTNGENGGGRKTRHNSNIEDFN